MNLMNFTAILTIFTFLIGSSVWGQSDTTNCVSKFDTVVQRQIYFIVDDMPIFPGGKDSLRIFLIENLKYPKRGGCFEGAVYVSFIVEPNGYLTNKKIIRGINEFADKEAISVLEKMPRWEPGTCQRITVPMKIILPIRFRTN